MSPAPRPVRPQDASSSFVKHFGGTDEQKKDLRKPAEDHIDHHESGEHIVISSLPLQIILYYHFWYDILALIVNIFIAVNKAENLKGDDAALVNYGWGNFVFRW